MALAGLTALAAGGLGIAGCHRPSFARDAQPHLNRITRSSAELFRSLAEGTSPSPELLVGYRQNLREARQLLHRHAGEASKPAYHAFEQWLNRHEEFAQLCEEVSQPSPATELDDRQRKQLVEHLNSLLRQGAEVRALLSGRNAEARSPG